MRIALLTALLLAPLGATAALLRSAGATCEQAIQGFLGGKCA